MKTCLNDHKLTLLAGANLNITQFGNGNVSASMTEGIMGVGWGYGVDTSYYNVIDQLYHQGITASRAFGLNLGSISATGNSLNCSSDFEAD
jgi:hypothetical protein